MKQFICVAAFAGALSLSGANAQQLTGVALEENGSSNPALRETLPIPAVITTPGSQLPPPGGNPLWGIPLSALSATRDRPVFTASRRPPAPPAASVPVAEEPPSPPPAEPEQPALTLVGTAIGETENVAVVVEQTSKNLVRLHVGESVSGWFLRSVDARSMTIEKESQTVTLALPAPDSAPVSPPIVAESQQASTDTEF